MLRGSHVLNAGRRLVPPSGNPHIPRRSLPTWRLGLTQFGHFLTVPDLTTFSATHRFPWHPSS
ncbi:MAG: hypothetical protein AAF628_32740 [Planctomycetota bacterium]